MISLRAQPSLKRVLNLGDRIRAVVTDCRGGSMFARVSQKLTKVFLMRAAIHRIQTGTTNCQAPVGIAWAGAANSDRNKHCERRRRHISLRNGGLFLLNRRLPMPPYRLALSESNKKLFVKANVSRHSGGQELREVCPGRTCSLIPSRRGLEDSQGTVALKNNIPDPQTCAATNAASRVNIFSFMEIFASDGRILM